MVADGSRRVVEKVLSFRIPLVFSHLNRGLEGNRTHDYDGHISRSKFGPTSRAKHLSFIHNNVGFKRAHFAHYAHLETFVQGRFNLTN